MIDETLEGAIKNSLFTIDFWGNTTSETSLKSEIIPITTRATLSNQRLQEIKAEAERVLQWLIEDGHFSQIQIETERQQKTALIRITPEGGDAMLFDIEQTQKDSDFQRALSIDIKEELRIKIPEDMTISVDASGFASADPDRFQLHGPLGTNVFEPSAPVTQLEFGRLILRVNGLIRAYEDEMRVRVKKDDEIIFVVNDADLSDNVGTFDIFIKRL